MDKGEVDSLLRKGAIDVLTSSDEAAQQFCEETIESILQKRAIVVKSGIQTAGTASTAEGAPTAPAELSSI